MLIADTDPLFAVVSFALAVVVFPILLYCYPICFWRSTLRDLLTLYSGEPRVVGDAYFRRCHLRRLFPANQSSLILGVILAGFLAFPIWLNSPEGYPSKVLLIVVVRSSLHFVTNFDHYVDRLERFFARESKKDTSEQETLTARKKDGKRVARV